MKCIADVGSNISSTPASSQRQCFIVNIVYLSKNAWLEKFVMLKYFVVLGTLLGPHASTCELFLFLILKIHIKISFLKFFLNIKKKNCIIKTQRMQSKLDIPCLSQSLNVHFICSILACVCTYIYIYIHTYAYTYTCTPSYSKHFWMLNPEIIW